jgi:hypothetical protein
MVGWMFEGLERLGLAIWIWSPHHDRPTSPFSAALPLALCPRLTRSRRGRRAQDATRAIADRIITAANAEGVFVNVRRDVAQVTHVQRHDLPVLQGRSPDRVHMPNVDGGPS